MGFNADLITKCFISVYSLLVLIKGTGINEWLHYDLLDTLTQWNHIFFLLFFFLILFVYKGQGLLGWVRRWVQPS